MTDTQRNKRPARRPDCVTETRIGNTILVVSGFFKEGATDTATDKIKCWKQKLPPDRIRQHTEHNTGDREKRSCRGA